MSSLAAQPSGTPLPDTPVARFLTGAEPLAVVPADEAELDAATARTLGWAVLLGGSAEEVEARAVQRTLADQLDLPGNAATSWDAFADALRDLPDRDEDSAGTLLVWTPAAAAGLESDAVADLIELLAEVAAETGRGSRGLKVMVASDLIAGQLADEESA